MEISEEIERQIQEQPEDMRDELRERVRDGDSFGAALLQAWGLRVSDGPPKNDE